MKPFLFSLAVASALAVPASVQAAPSWSGTYVYEENGGRTAGGTAILVTHTLTLSKTRGAWTGLLSSDGYQTFIRARCVGRAEGNRFDVIFKSSSEGAAFGAKRGDRLFSLLRRGRRLHTQWDKFFPVTKEKAPPTGEYFRPEESG